MQYISQINFKDDANIDVTYLITLRSFRTQDILDFAIREKKGWFVILGQNPPIYEVIKSWSVGPKIL
jgi:hypothetical protein